MNSKKIIYYPYDKIFPHNLNFVALTKSISKNSDHRFHWHDYFECEIILSGEGEHRFNDSVYRLSPGSAYLLSYFDSHAFTAHSEMKVFSIRFNENMFSEDITELLLTGEKCKCVFDKDELQYIRQRIERIEKEKPDLAFYGHMMSALVSELILLIIRKANIHPEKNSPSLVQKTQTHIIRRFREHISLKSIAKELSVTPKYLGVVFKEHTGMFFNDYLNNLRLKYACNLLIVSDLSVKEIAFASGYASVEYFLDVFKRNTGMTPTAYRNIKTVK